MNEILNHVIEIVATIIEMIGVIVIIVAVSKGIYRLVVVRRFNFEEEDKDAILTTGLSSALEILLAAEILKTLIARSSDAIIEVGALVVIRILITIIIHWELIQKEKHLDVQKKEKEAAESE